MDCALDESLTALLEPALSSTLGPALNDDLDWPVETSLDAALIHSLDTVNNAGLARRFGLSLPAALVTIVAQPLAGSAT
ncbi:MAG: hypothetical protein R6X13_05145 [bacterium]